MRRTVLPVSILITAGLHASATTAPPGAPISLSFSGPATNSEPKGEGVSAGGSGTLSPFGAATLGIRISASKGAQTGAITFTFTFTAADTLTASSIITKASGYVSGSLGTVSGTATVTQGTGAFTSYTGSFSYLLTVVAETSFSLTGSGIVTIVQVFPHVAADTSWQTDFVILNTTSAPVAFALILHPDTGTTVPIAGLGPVSQITGTVAANGTAFFTTDTTADSDGWAELDSAAPLSGVAVFREANDQTSVLLTTPATNFAIPFDSTAPPNAPSTPYVDGLAIANSDSVNTASITCQAYDSSGTALGGSLTGLAIPPSGHVAFLLQSTAPFTSLPSNTRGQLACASSTPVAAVELRALGPQVSTLPVVTAQ